MPFYLPGGLLHSKANGPVHTAPVNRPGSGGQFDNANPIDASVPTAPFIPAGLSSLFRRDDSTFSIRLTHQGQRPDSSQPGLSARVGRDESMTPTRLTNEGQRPDSSQPGLSARVGRDESMNPLRLTNEGQWLGSKLRLVLEMRRILINSPAPYTTRYANATDRCPIRGPGRRFPRSCPPGACRH